MTDREAFDLWLEQSKIKGTVRELHVAWAAWQAALASERQQRASWAGPEKDFDLMALYVGSPAVQQQAEPVALERYGVVFPYGSEHTPTLVTMPDGYWTPWHIANEALQRAAPPAVQGELSMSMFATKADFDAAVKDMAGPVTMFKSGDPSYNDGFVAGYRYAKAAPPADDEAVRLLREARKWVDAFPIPDWANLTMADRGKLCDEIDAYLARVSHA